MQTLLKKENLLFNTVSKQTTDLGFDGAFLDYFTFLSAEGLPLLVHLNEDVSKRNKRESLLEKQYEDVETQFQKTYIDVEKIVKKLGLENDPLIIDRMGDYKSLLEHTTFVIGGSKFESMLSEYSDVLRYLEKLGHTSEVKKFIESLSHNRKEYRYQDLKLYMFLQQYKEAQSDFHKEDALSLAGALARLAYAHGLLKNKKPNQIERENISADLDRIHASIVLNDSMLQKESIKIFTLKGDEIFHFQIGKIDYSPRPNGQDPKYIRLFKLILEYFPDNKQEMRIAEFNKLLSEKDRFSGETYRTQLMQEKSSFMKLLQRQNIKNIHPETKKPILNITNTIIRFNNFAIEE